MIGEGDTTIFHCIMPKKIRNKIMKPSKNNKRKIVQVAMNKGISGITMTKYEWDELIEGKMHEEKFTMFIK